MDDELEEVTNVTEINQIKIVIYLKDVSKQMYIDLLPVRLSLLEAGVYSRFEERWGMVDTTAGYRLGVEMVTSKHCVHGWAN